MKISSTYLLYIDGLNLSRHFSNHFPSWWTKNALAKIGPSGEPIETPSICLYSFPLKTKDDYFKAKVNNSQNVVLFIPLITATSLYNLSQQIFIVSRKGILVKSTAPSIRLLDCMNTSGKMICDAMKGRAHAADPQENRQIKLQWTMVCISINDLHRSTAVLFQSQV